MPQGAGVNLHWTHTYALANMLFAMLKHRDWAGVLAGLFHRIG